MLTAERLRELVTYDPDTGIMLRKLRTSNSTHVGDVVGTPHICGYREAHMEGGRYLMHRLAWLYVHGEWPPRYVDHINGNRSDNRIANLRLANPRQSVGNTFGNSRNTSGYKGVSWDKRNKVWRAYIAFNRRYQHLGYFKNKEDAARAYQLAAEKHFGEFASHLSRNASPQHSSETPR
jgi:hypothetical protein